MEFKPKNNFNTKALRHPHKDLVGDIRYDIFDDGKKIGVLQCYITEDFLQLLLNKAELLRTTDTSFLNVFFDVLLKDIEKHTDKIIRDIMNLSFKRRSIHFSNGFKDSENMLIANADGFCIAWEKHIDQFDHKIFIEMTVYK